MIVIRLDDAYPIPPFLIVILTILPPDILAVPAKPAPPDMNTYAYV